jgi:hypothetical protein
MLPASKPLSTMKFVLSTARANIATSRRGVIVMTNRNKRLFPTLNDQEGGLVDLVLTSAR